MPKAKRDDPTAGREVVLIVRDFTGKILWERVVSRGYDRNYQRTKPPTTRKRKASRGA